MMSRISNGIEAGPPTRYAGSGGHAGDRTRTQRVGFWLGLVLFLAIITLPTPAGMRRVVESGFGGVSADTQVVETRARAMLAAAAVTAVVACWWITVAIPIPVTSLLPLLLFPLVGVMSIQEAAAPYANSNVFLFLGGFIIALSIERWGLHRRIALHIVDRVGTSERRIVLGFMAASAGLSMWISNTATTLMILPIGLAIISSVRELGDPVTTHEGSRRHGNFSAALMLGIAYGASIGGIATPIGTPPNIAFRGQFARLFPEAPEISFGQWVLVFLPLVILFLPVVWIILVRITCPLGERRGPRSKKSEHASLLVREVIAENLRQLGPMRTPEVRVLTIFVLTALLWMTRTVTIGDTDYGWSMWLQRWLSDAPGGPIPFHAAYINDATVALGMAVLLFAIPAGCHTDATGPRREALMDWATARRLPWGILLLFGGGFSIAAGFRTSGLSQWCGQVFAGVSPDDPLSVVGVTCLMMTFLTEVTSNTATTQVMLPILAQVSTSMHVHPLLLMLPATVSASCAFMMPVATPPNAIVFGSGCIEMGRMVKTGIIINLVGVLLVTATFYLVAAPILGIDLSTIPSWAQ